MPNNAPACLAATTCAALNLGKHLGYVSAALAVAALLNLCVASFSGHAPGAAVLIFWAGSLVAFLGQSYYQLRVLFDAQLFAQLATRLSAEIGGEIPLQDALAIHLSHLDQALFNLGLAPTPSGPPRLLEARVRGAMRLLKCQAAYLLAQLLLFGVALIQGL